VRRSVRVLFGKEALREMPVIMVSEDFAYYLKHTKGAFIFLGVGNEKIGANAPHHSPHFVIDEGALYRGIALLAHLAYAQSKVIS
jgi:metal-dependent amidase/aminoacylase/carboxypeptidase family protein